MMDGELEIIRKEEAVHEALGVPSKTAKRQLLYCGHKFKPSVHLTLSLSLSH
jgi:hypothetical protein